jgi:hypothetical protein
MFSVFRVKKFRSIFTVTLPKSLLGFKFLSAVFHSGGEDVTCESAIMKEPTSGTEKIPKSQWSLLVKGHPLQSNLKKQIRKITNQDLTDN